LSYTAQEMQATLAPWAKPALIYGANYSLILGATIWESCLTPSLTHKMAYPEFQKPVALNTAFRRPGRQRDYTLDQ
jgi:hypothetical protein